MSSLEDEANGAIFLLRSGIAASGTLIEIRKKARLAGKFELADKIRNALRDAGYTVTDLPGGLSVAGKIGGHAAGLRGMVRMGLGTLGPPESTRLNIPWDVTHRARAKRDGLVMRPHLLLDNALWGVF